MRLWRYRPFWPCHPGIGSLNVVRSIGRLLDHGSLSQPLVKDGDLIAVIQRMIHARDLDTVRVTEFKGHAAEAGVDQGRVRVDDRLGNADHDERGGSAPDPLVWDHKSRKKQRKVEIRVNIDLTSLPGSPGFLHRPWIQVHGGCITGADVATWPESASLVCNLLNGNWFARLLITRVLIRTGHDEMMVVLRRPRGHRLKVSSPFLFPPYPPSRD